jgi:ADP-heptose:LPS heptosyltransferase
LNNWLERFVDRWAGIIICFVLTLLEKLRCALRGRRELPPVKRILFIKPVEQGALVLAYGAMKHAAEKVGAENVFVFVFQKNREIVDILGIIPAANVITARDENLLVFSMDMIAAFMRMWRVKIDTAVDLEIFARISIIIAWFSGARRRVGLHRFNMEGPYRGDLVTHRVQYNPYLHTAQAFDVFLRAAFAKPDDAPLLKEVPQSSTVLPPRFVPDSETLATVDALLAPVIAGKSPNEKPGPIFLFNPKCLDELPARKWPDECYVELGRKLLEIWPDGRLLVVGLEHEQQLCESMAASIDPNRAFSLAGRLTLRTLVTLMTRCDLLVTSDSGPAHFAALTDIAGVVFFGPETPLLYSPLSDRLRVLYLGLACSPCYSPMNYRLSPCKDNRCLTNICADRVCQEIRELLVDS